MRDGSSDSSAQRFERSPAVNWFWVFLKQLSRAELEHLTNALEAILEGEGSPLPPLSAS
jgi:hypothetical protein